MRTGLTKKQKTTVIYFDEHSRIIEVQTHNTDLKKRLTAFAAKYPQCCRQTDDDEQGGLTFEIEKGRLSFAVQEAANSLSMSARPMSEAATSAGRSCATTATGRGWSTEKAIRWKKEEKGPTESGPFLSLIHISEPTRP